MHLRVTDDAPANLSYPYTGRLEAGDTFEVDDEKGAALIDAHDYLETVVDLNEDEYEDVTAEVADDDLESRTYDELYERASEADIDGRGDMSKAELVDALQEE